MGTAYMIVVQDQRTGVSSQEERARVQTLVGIGGGRLGHLHDLSRQQRDERRDPDHPARPAPVDRGPGVGGQQLHPGVRRAAAGRRPAGRRVRPAAAVRDRAVGVHAGLARRGAGRQRQRADRGAAGAGPGRRAHGADHAGHHRGHLHRPPRADPRDRRLGRDRRARPGLRPAHRRLHQPAPALGLDLPDQRADRRDHHGHRPGVRPRVAGHLRRPPPRRARAGRLRGRAVLAHLRAHRGTRQGLDVRDHPRRAGPRRRWPAGCSRSSSRAPSTRWSRCHCSARGRSAAGSAP